MHVRKISFMRNKISQASFIDNITVASNLAVADEKNNEIPFPLNVYITPKNFRMW